MSEILQKIRDAVSGKKTIITAIIGLLTAALAWAGGELTDWQALAAAWVAIQIIFIRSGAKRDAVKAAFTSTLHAYQTGNRSGSAYGYGVGYEEGYDAGYYEDEDEE